MHYFASDVLSEKQICRVQMFNKKKKNNFPLVNNILSIYSWTSFCCTFAFQYKETRSSPLHRA